MAIARSMTAYDRTLQSAAQIPPQDPSMASSAFSKAAIPPADIESFSAYLQASQRILALLGAGLSASSGLPTFRGAGGLWRTYDAMSLATPAAFNADPGLVWQFYSYRRHMALNVKPNEAHYALAEFSRRKDGFLTLSQNVDGLSQRAHHPSSKLHLLHGSLYDVKCTSFYCDYAERDNFTDPIVPALALPEAGSQPTGFFEESMSVTTDEPVCRDIEGSTTEVDISDERVALPELRISDLPHCPKCKSGILRPAVVWFGESLPGQTLSAVEKWIDDSDRIDLIMVIGTSAKVWPAAGYVDSARAKGARVAVVNMDRADTPGDLVDGDWFFEGDAAVVIPEILKSVVGDVEKFME
ncbi:MAG: hypothetical protein M1819_001811 [Sarea resinae]|nr:MAG: hypothetical protein M1819_001811 [Sarea resinae]